MAASLRARPARNLANLAHDDDAPPGDVYNAPTRVGPMSKNLIDELLRKTEARPAAETTRPPPSRIVPKTLISRGNDVRPWLGDDDVTTLEPTLVQHQSPQTTVRDGARNATPTTPAPPCPNAFVAQPIRAEREIAIAPPPPRVPAFAEPIFSIAPLPPAPPRMSLHVAAPPPAADPQPAKGPAPRVHVAAPMVPQRDPWLVAAIIAGVVALSALVPALYVVYFR